VLEGGTCCLERFPYPAFLNATLLLLDPLTRVAVYQDFVLHRPRVCWEGSQQVQMDHFATAEEHSFEMASPHFLEEHLELSLGVQNCVPVQSLRPRCLQLKARSQDFQTVALA